MKYYIKISVYLLLIFQFSCSDNKQEKLVVEELYISKHQVAPQRSHIIFYKNGKIFNEENIPEEPCFSGIKISHLVYYPKLIININSMGRLIGFLRECPKEGYIDIMLNDSLITFFNNQIQRINFKNLDSLYSGNGEGFTEYFISIKNGTEEKQIMIMQDYEGTKILRKFIDSIYNYINTLKLQDTVYIPFRYDTVIVKKTEEYWKLH